jgi:hypothetical protein
MSPKPSSKEELSSVVSRIMKTLQRDAGLLKRLFQKMRSNMSPNSFQELSARVIKKIATIQVHGASFLAPMDLNSYNNFIVECNWWPAKSPRPLRLP